MKRTKDFTIEYNYFEPGTLVTPTSNRCPLEYGKTFKITMCREPMWPGDDCVVFVRGRTTGISSEYLKKVE